MPYNAKVRISSWPSVSPTLSLPASLSLSLSLLLSCASPCSHGPTTTCWCPGDAIGESACGEDGRYGVCVCPGSPGLTPTTVVPTPVVVPPPPPPPGLMIPSTIPPGVDPPPTSTAAPARDAAIAAWITGPLRGHDNRSAAIRSATVTGVEGAYQIYIQNQFGFRCDLEFDAAGMPAAMRGCRSRERDWSASPDLIAVRCEDRGADVRCEAPYQLQTRDGYHSRESFVFSRRLGAPTRRD